MKTSQLVFNFQLIEDKLNDAYVNNDCEKLEELLSNGWTIVEPSFGIISKTDFLKLMKEGKLVHSKMRKEVLQVKNFDNIVIVISRGKNIGEYLNVHFETEIWVTNVFRIENSRWVCISTQEAPIPCE
jgi:hypothetical protein